MGNTNISFLIGGTFFFLFLLFILFQPNSPVISGSAVQLILEKDSFLINQPLDGKIKLTLSQGDFIPADASLTLSVKNAEGNAVVSRSMTVQEYFTKSGASNVPKVSRDGVEGYELPATYVVDMIWFTLIVSNQGDFNLEAKITKDNIEIIKVQKPIHLVSSGGGQSPRVIDVGFYLFDEEGQPLEDETEFMREERVGCFVTYAGEVQDSSAKIYSSGETLVPTYQFTHQDAELAETVINGTTYNTLVYSKEVDVTKLGQWGCSVKLSNAQGSTTKIASGSLTQINSPPFKFKDLPQLIKLDASGVVLNNAGIAEPLDIAEFFRDSDDDELEISVLPEPEKAVFVMNTRLKAYTGSSETIYFKVFDGEKFIMSIPVKLSGGNVGGGLPSCTPSWTTTEWGPCIAGKQTRIVYDKNGCGIETGKPLTMQQCSSVFVPPEREVKYELEPQEPRSNNAGVILILIVLLAGLAGGGIYLMMRKTKEEMSKKEKVVTKVVYTKEHVHKLSQYVDTMIKKGYDVDKIKDTLNKVGWPKIDVEMAIRYVKLKHYVEEQVKKGVPKEKIKEALVQKGWRKELIDEVL